MALLKPLLEPRTYEFVEPSNTVPTLGDELGLLQHTNFSVELDRRITRVNRYRPGSRGYDYFGIRAADTTSEGAALINDRDELQGIRMPSQWLLEHEIANPGEVWAVDAPKIAGVALPILRSGHVRIEPVTPEGPIGHPDQYWYGVLNGRITIDGADAPTGARLHMRVRKEGLPDYWVTEQIHESGFFLLSIDPGRRDYSAGAMEFWTDCRRSPVTAVLERFAGLTQRLDLAF